ncbi:protein LATERAL ROOT PRIMORDIUM 1-like [Curcuma longa]|uniref:protein LATERAL ROOT PRIMORDIUM 1-like n=1 Tax=Curcuma longa TaxID=136217 RepID=UPI003D9DEE01
MGTVVLASAASFHHHHLESLPSVPAAAPLIPPQHLLSNPNPNAYFSNYSMHPMLDSRGEIAGCAAGGGVSTCQDCGNQAKKDCTHRRCRTCCKSRGFECSTHVKSTWVPAARRRERQLAAVASAPKKPRVSASSLHQPPAAAAAASHTSTSNTTPPRSIDTTSSLQNGGDDVGEILPVNVRSPAVFKCVRVSSMDDDGEDEYAYHAVIKIGGRVFKGFLFDQGCDNDASIPNMSKLHVGNKTSTDGGASSPALPCDIFGGCSGGLIGDANYDGNQIN